MDIVFEIIIVLRAIFIVKFIGWCNKGNYVGKFPTKDVVNSLCCLIFLFVGPGVYSNNRYLGVIFVTDVHSSGNNSIGYNLTVGVVVL